MSSQPAVPDPVKISFQPEGEVLASSDKDHEDGCHQHTSTNIMTQRKFSKQKEEKGRKLRTSKRKKPKLWRDTIAFPSPGALSKSGLTGVAQLTAVRRQGAYRRQLYYKWQGKGMSFFYPSFKLIQSLWNFFFQN